MHKTVYMCDYCGKDMGNSPEFTVMFRSNGLAVYEPEEWHYCKDCWEQVKKTLANKDDKVEELKKENEKLKKDAQWYENFFNSMWKAFAESFYGKNWVEIGDSSECCSDQKDGLFSAGCCAENTNKDSLHYKQTTAPYSSLK